MSTSTVSRRSGVAPGAAKAPSKQSVSLSDLQKRTAAAAKLESIFNGIKPGQKLENGEVYLDRLKSLENQALQDYHKLFNPKITVTEPVKQARAALEQQIATLRKAIAAARSANVIPAAPKGDFPWSGKLRDAKDTPLHWAVRNRDYQTALFVRGQTRMHRMAMLCQHYIGTVKNGEVAALLKKQGFGAKLLPALEKLHLLNFQTLDAKAVQKICGDAEVLKVVQDPDFKKIFADPNGLTIFNGLDVLLEEDSRKLNPIDEAELQQDSKMKEILLFPHFVMNSELKKLFWGRINEIRGRIAEMRQVDPNTLTDVCRAAYLGDIDQLQAETDFNVKDEKGLTPLHYALLGRQQEAAFFLLNRCDNYTLTPKGHSYYDYALISGHPGFVNVFERLNIPFRLGGAQERFSYLLATGIFDRELAAIARSKDPIAMGGRDQDFFGVNLNVLWAGSALINRAIFGINPTSANVGWLAYPTFLTESGAWGFNHHWLGAQQVFRLLPPWAVMPVAHTYGWVMAIWQWTNLGRLLGFHAGAALAPEVLKKVWDNSHVGTAAKAWGVAGQVLSVVRLYAAIKPVFDRLPAYYDAYATRPNQVRKALAWDVFNIGTQALMSLGSFT